MPLGSPSGPETPDSWNYSAFVNFYNRIARAQSGRPYEQDDNTPHLPTFYKRGGYATLESFAEARFMMEQRN